MRLRAWSLVLILAVPAITAAPAFAETLDLRSGKTLAGEVTLGEGDLVIMDARFPTSERIQLRRSDLTPASLYRVLERRVDSKDPQAKRELGELAEEAGLKGAAIAEFRAVMVLDPGSKKDMDGRIQALMESLAADILADARDLLAEGRTNASVMYLHTLKETYPGTRAAREADRVLAEATKAAGPSVDVAMKTVDASAATRVLDVVDGHLQRGDAFTKDMAGHASSVADGRAAERAVAHFEAAWEAAKTLPVSTGDDALNARIVKARNRAKSTLVHAYLTAGTVHLQRRSLPEAERWCNRACELDPENKPNHTLHRLILQAKALSIGRGAVGGRVIVQTPATAESEVTYMDPSADYPLKECVVSGKGLGSMGGTVAIMYDGTEVQFCCKGCVKEFLANAPRFLEKVRAAFKAAGK